MYVHIYFSSCKKAEEDIRFRKQFDAVRADMLSGALEASDMDALNREDVYTTDDIFTLPEGSARS